MQYTTVFAFPQAKTQFILACFEQTGLRDNVQGQVRGYCQPELRQDIF